MTDRTTTHDPTTSREPGSRDYSSASGASGVHFDDSERERARLAAEEIKTAAKDAASSTASALRNRLSGELDYRKYRSRQRLHRVAEALRQTSANVNAEDDAIARYIDRAAERVDGLAQYLDQKDVNSILHDAREMARRRPEIFVGGLFIAGVMLGRFLRSSAPEESFDRTWDDYPAYAGGGTGGPYPPSPTVDPYPGVSNPYSGSGANAATPPGADRMP